MLAKGLLSCCALMALLSVGPVQAAEALPEIATQVDDEFARFAPTGDEQPLRLDWGLWDRALNWFVLNMGPSLRRFASRPVAYAGTHLTFGHDSRYRLEGNRVAFSIMKEKQIGALTEYRLDLERIGSELPLSQLPRNEQLAFWLNVHNVAVIEQIALAYPTMKPHKIKPEGFDAPLDDAKFITVAGVAMSPKDIRTRIVYLNWGDPRVMYGFFRGDIGGPSISKRSFTGQNVATLLAENATEFVNALRGVERRGDTMRVSKIYEEARPFYFRDWSADIRAHVAHYAEDDVQSILARTGEVEAVLYETDLADLSKGEREPDYLNVTRCIRDGLEMRCAPPGMNAAVWMYLEERREKIEVLIRQDRIGTVIIRELREVDEEEGAEVE